MAAPSVSVTPFGEYKGQVVRQYVLCNGHGMSASIITYGAILRKLEVPDALGNRADVVLGFDSLEEYVESNPFFGATVGRYAGRIEGAVLSVDGTSPRQLPVSDGESIGRNCLHGGTTGFDKVVWAASVAGDATVKLTHVSPDGDQGFPGEVHVSLSYTLTAEGGLLLEYGATTTATTPLSLTNHTYFNLRGAGDIRGHTLHLSAPVFFPVTPDGIPTGEERSVEGSARDFASEARVLGPAMDAIALEAPEWPHGDAYLLDNTSAAATLRDPVSGRTMVVETTEPICQTYFSTLLDATGKGGERHEAHAAVCLEMQRPAAAVNHPAAPLPFEVTPAKAQYVERYRPCALLRAGEVYRQRTLHTFACT